MKIWSDGERVFARCSEGDCTTIPNSYSPKHPEKGSVGGVEDVYCVDCGKLALRVVQKAPITQ